MYRHDEVHGLGLVAAYANSSIVRTVPVSPSPPSSGVIVCYFYLLSFPLYCTACRFVQRTYVSIYTAFNICIHAFSQCKYTGSTGNKKKKKTASIYTDIHTGSKYSQYCQYIHRYWQYIQRQHRTLSTEQFTGSVPSSAHRSLKGRGWHGLN